MARALRTPFTLSCDPVMVDLDGSGTIEPPEGWSLLTAAEAAASMTPQLMTRSSSDLNYAKVVLAHRLPVGIGRLDAAFCARWDSARLAVAATPEIAPAVRAEHYNSELRELRDSIYAIGNLSPRLVVLLDRQSTVAPVGFAPGGLYLIEALRRWGYDPLSLLLVPCRPPDDKDRGQSRKLIESVARLLTAESVRDAVKLVPWRAGTRVLKHAAILAYRPPQPGGWASKGKPIEAYTAKLAELGVPRGPWADSPGVLLGEEPSELLSGLLRAWADLPAPGRGGRKSGRPAWLTQARRLYVQGRATSPSVAARLLGHPKGVQDAEHCAEEDGWHAAREQFEAELERRVLDNVAAHEADLLVQARRLSVTAAVETWQGYIQRLRDGDAKPSAHDAAVATKAALMLYESVQPQKATSADGLSVEQLALELLNTSRGWHGNEPLKEIPASVILEPVPGMELEVHSEQG